MKRKIRNFIIILIIFISSVFLVGSRYFLKTYPDESFDQILYYVMNGVGRDFKKCY